MAVVLVVVAISMFAFRCKHDRAMLLSGCSGERMLCVSYPLRRPINNTPAGKPTAR